MISSDNALLFSYALWLFGRVDYGVPLDRLREVIARWFFMAHTTGRYTGTFETRFEQDTARFADLKPGDADGYIRVLSKIVDDTLTADYWAITLPNDLATSASKSPALLAYIAALNILDADALLSVVKVRARLDPAVTAKKGIERHHLFPRAYLRSQLKITDNREINQIANMALVEWADNIAISDDAPAIYWPAQLSAKNLPSEMLNRQLYWHALPSDWQDMNYQAFLADRRKLMAQVTRDAYMKLSDHGYIPVYPEAGHLRDDDQPGGRTHYGVNLADLIESELLPAGTTLFAAQRDLDAIATVLPDGKIAYADEIFNTPSGVGDVAAGGSTNGWTFWIADTPDGRFTLAALREQLTVRQQ